jgi:hypothetical protein
MPRGSSFAGGIHVVTDDFVRAGGLAHVHQRAQRYHLAGGIACFEFADVLGAKAEVRVGLRGDLIRATKAIEIVHIE